MAVQLAAEEINAAGGILGRKDRTPRRTDSVNPQTASDQGRALDRARQGRPAIIGEISSASALPSPRSQRATRRCSSTPAPIRTRCAARTASATMFHVEAQNSMYVKAVGRSLIRDGLVKGKRWYSLTADYAFGHDLLKVSPSASWRANGGNFAGDDSGADRRHRLLGLPAEDPRRPGRISSDLNLAGNQITNFLKQYAEFGLTFPVAGFGFDTALAWGGGQGQLRRHLAGASGITCSTRPAAKSFRRGLHQEVQQAAGEPGLGRLHRHQDRGARPMANDPVEIRGVDPRSSNTSRSGAKFDRAEDAARPTSAGRDHQLMQRNVCGDRAAGRQDQEPVGHLRIEPGRFRVRTSRHGSDGADDQGREQRATFPRAKRSASLVIPTPARYERSDSCTPM